MIKNIFFLIFVNLIFRFFVFFKFVQISTFGFFSILSKVGNKFQICWKLNPNSWKLNLQAQKSQRIEERILPIVPATERRRVKLINYKGGSGRILGAKLNKNNENHHQKIIFSTKFANVRKIKKWMWRKIQKTKS